ncbi:Rrf2 family transcriptional regulator [Deinococcus depolymerans]|uniref:RrF2 family transcriptional regulator n=1 Tax=Deinococcus depolymerans TaxID=392408 RepID=A0ABP3MAI8_9DEIO
MWLSTRAQYGLRALIDIGRHHGQFVSLRDVSRRQGISHHYLEQLVGPLRRAGFIRSVRGAHGGYRLARPPHEITAYEVVIVMEGSLAPVACVEPDHACQAAGVCGTQALWKRVDDALRDVLDRSTLRDLILEAESGDHARLLQLT